MNFLPFSVSFAALALVVVSAQHDPNYCYATDPIKPQLARFSSRTSHESIRGRVINPGVSTCTPAKFWFYYRHAARLPGVNDIGRMSTIQTQVNNIIAARAAGRGQAVCQQDFNLINNWSFGPNITVAVEQFLTVAGWNEINCAVCSRSNRIFSCGATVERMTNVTFCMGNIADWSIFRLNTHFHMKFLKK